MNQIKIYISLFLVAEVLQFYIWLQSFNVTELQSLVKDNNQ